MTARKLRTGTPIAAAQVIADAEANGVTRREIACRLGATLAQLSAVLEHGAEPSPQLANALALADMSDCLPDPVGDAELVRHIEMLHRLAAPLKGKGKLTLASFGQDPATGEDIRPRVRRFEIGDAAGMTATARAWQWGEHRNVYAPWCVMRSTLPAGKKGSEADVVAVLATVCDFDAKDDPAAARYAERMPVSPAYVVESSPGSFQATVILDQPYSVAEAKPIMAALIDLTGCDKTSKDASHVWRLPGTNNWPNKAKADVGRPLEPARARVVKPWDGAAVASLAQVRAAIEAGGGCVVASPQVAAPKIEPQPLNISPLSPDVQRLIEDGAPVGERSDKFLFVIGELRRAGYTQEAAAALLAEHPDGIAAKYTGRLEKEVARCWGKVSDRRAAEEFTPVEGTTNVATGRVLPFEFAADVQPRLTSQYLVKGVLDAGAMSVIYGDSNEGKTFVALSLAYAIATGTEWHGRQVKQGAVMYVAAEGPASARQRIAAIKKHFGKSDFPLVLVPCAVNLLDKNGDVISVIETAKAASLKAGVPVELIIVDTVSRTLSGGDENSSTDMGAFVKNVDRIRSETGAHVSVIHHTGKDKTKGARGHSLLRAAADTELEIDGRKIKATKQRDMDAGAPLGFDLSVVQLGVDDDGDAITSCVVVPASASARRDFAPAEVKGQPGRALAILRKVIEAEGRPLPDEPDGAFRRVGVPEDAWAAACEGGYLSKGSKETQKRIFRGVKKSLESAGLITMRGGFVGLCEGG